MKLYRVSLALGATALVSTLSACGGSETTPPVYYELSNAAGEVSTLAGTAGRVDPTTDIVTLQTTTGTVDHSSGALSITDDQVTFTDADGPDSNPTVGYQSGSDSLTAISSTLISETYDFVVPYQQAYTDNGNVYRSTGVLGVVTSSGDVPASGTATYTGQGAIFVKDGTAQASLGSTSSTVDADFGSGNVDVTLTGVTGDMSSIAAFDTVSATGMAISGNSFTGGVIDVTSSGTSVAQDIAGSGYTTGAAGNFFGYDASAGGPDEAAGTIIIDGLEGNVIAVFAAD